jgi:hypothetical protein
MGVRRRAVDKGPSPLPGRLLRSYAAAMLRWVQERSRYLWLSLAIGVVAGVAALPSFTDPWPSSAGGFVFVVGVVTALVRGSIALGLAFQQGWREPRQPSAR